MRVRLFFLLGLILSASIFTAQAQAEGNAIENLPGCTANTFEANDDLFVSGVPLGFTINFGSNEYNSTYVNNNGNITFQQGLSTYTPFDFTATGETIIAPYLADVDTRGTGSSLTTYGTGELEGGVKYFCVNWVNVGYYNEHADKLNSFQLILTQSPSQAPAGNFTMTFNYDKIQWETGDASDGNEGFGGTPAAVGYSDGIEGGYVQNGSFASGSFEDGNGATGLIYQSINAGGQPGRLVFEYSFEALTPPTDGILKGKVLLHESSQAASGAPVEICPTEGGTCILRTTNNQGEYRAAVPPGTYNLTAYPPQGSPSYEGHRNGVKLKNAKETLEGQDIELGAALTPPPEGSGVSSVGTGEGGIPVTYMNQPSKVTTIACTGAPLEFQITNSSGEPIAGGPMHEVPGSQNAIDDSSDYEATYTPPASAHGSAHVKITGTCPVGATKIDVEFDVYIDPSGHVIDTNGHPITNATVTLYRSSTAKGTFTPIPTGSGEMSPGNRVNPAVDPEGGVFSWDVVPGFYEIRATAPGCVSASNHAQSAASTGILQIPPPADGLVLTLYCGPLSQPSPPPVATKADSGFLLKSVKTNANGTISVTLVPTQAGRATFSATVPTAKIARIEALAAKHGKHCRRGTTKIHGKCRPVTSLYGSTAGNGSAGAPLTLTIAPSAQARAALAKGRTLHLAATLSYQSTLGGSPTVKAFGVTVKLKKHKKKHHGHGKGH
jgi:hypothetical protein